MRQFDCLKYSECLGRAAKSDGFFDCENCKELSRVYTEATALPDDIKIDTPNGFVVFNGKKSAQSPHATKKKKSIPLKETNLVTQNKATKPTEINPKILRIEVSIDDGKNIFNQIAKKYYEELSKRYEEVEEKIQELMIEGGRLLALTADLNNYLETVTWGEAENKESLISLFKDCSEIFEKKNVNEKDLVR